MFEHVETAATACRLGPSADSHSHFLGGGGVTPFRAGAGALNKRFDPASALRAIPCSRDGHVR